MSGLMACPACGAKWDPVGTDAWRRGEHECPKCGAAYVPARADDVYFQRPGTFLTQGYGALQRKAGQ